LRHRALARFKCQVHRANAQTVVSETFPAGNEMDDGWTYISQKAVRTANDDDERHFLRQGFKIFQDSLERAWCCYASRCGDVFQKSSYAAAPIPNIDQSRFRY
jgi:hypothetical protein